MLKGKIGVEIECIYPRNKYSELREFCNSHNIEFSGDGSVQLYGVPENGIPGQNYRDSDDDRYSTAEFNGMGLVFDLSQKKEFFDTIQQLFKFGIKVNSSCGLHIHLSFKQNSNYFKLLRFDFINQFQEEIRKLLVTPYERMRLTNRYCVPYNDKKEFTRITNKQVVYMGKCSERYHSVNYNSFNLHKTIEFRIFPATAKISTFKRYVNFLLKNVEKYLKNAKFKQIEIEHRHIITETHTITTKIIIPKEKFTELKTTGIDLSQTRIPRINEAMFPAFLGAEE